MSSRSRLALASLLAALAACSQDTFMADEPRIVVTAHETQYYSAFDDVTHTIDLGEVPVFATKRAVFKIENPTRQILEVQSVTYESTTGTRWDEASVDPRPSGKYKDTDALDFSVAAYGEVLLTIPYSPRQEGAHELVALVRSNAVDDGELEIRVQGTGIFTGEPDIEVEYSGYRGPAPDDCVGGEAGATCVIPAQRGLDFGNIGLGGRGTARLIIRNTAACTTFEGVDPCSLCSLTVAPNAALRNIGLGFAPGTNDDNYFKFEGSTATPFDLPQRNIECDNTGEIRLMVSFQAPETDGVFETSILIESSDPDEPLIEIPVRAAARNAPIAVAGLREYDPLNPSGPFSEASSIEPLTRVYLDGRGSYDPADPSDPSLIGGYSWRVIEFPSGLDVNDFAMQGDDQALFDFWLPLAGHYVAQLTVWNSDGVQSGDTPESRVEFDVIPGSRMHVQLTWDDPTNDQDLHLLYLAQTDTLCVEPWDCYFSNKEPVWFDAAPQGEGPNPRLDIDDTNGLGPENINIDHPSPGTYRVAVHNWSSHGTPLTRNTIRIFINGIQVAEYRRHLSASQKWLVADITWMPDGTGYVSPYPSDAQGEIGELSGWTTSQCSSY